MREAKCPRTHPPRLDGDSGVSNCSAPNVSQGKFTPQLILKKQLISLHPSHQLHQNSSKPSKHTHKPHYSTRVRGLPSSSWCGASSSSAKPFSTGCSPELHAPCKKWPLAAPSKSLASIDLRVDASTSFQKMNGLQAHVQRLSQPVSPKWKGCETGYQSSAFQIRKQPAGLCGGRKSKTWRGLNQQR